MSDKPEKNKKRGSEKTPGTLSALLKEKPKRGRPPRAVSRKNVYVSLTDAQKALLTELADKLPDGLNRADLPDLAITILATRLDAMRQAVADRNREIPEGITDLESLYLLWDLPLPEVEGEARWTSIRVSPQQGIELGRAHGTLNVVFGANRSEIFSLGLALLEQYLAAENSLTDASLAEARQRIRDNFL